MPVDVRLSRTNQGDRQFYSRLFRAEPFRRRSLKSATGVLRYKDIRLHRTGRCRLFSTSHREELPRFVWDRVDNLRRCLARAAKAFRFRTAKVFGPFPVREFPRPSPASTCQLSINGWMIARVLQPFSVPDQADLCFPPALSR